MQEFLEDKRWNLTWAEPNFRCLSSEWLDTSQGVFLIPVLASCRGTRDLHVLDVTSVTMLLQAEDRQNGKGRNNGAAVGKWLQG